MQGAFFRMKEHDKETDKGKDRHDKKEQPYRQLHKRRFFMCFVIDDDDMGHFFARCLAVSVPKDQGDKCPQGHGEKRDVGISLLGRFYAFYRVHEARLVLHRVVAEDEVDKKTDGDTDHKHIYAEG